MTILEGIMLFLGCLITITKMPWDFSIGIS